MNYTQEYPSRSRSLARITPFLFAFLLLGCTGDTCGADATPWETDTGWSELMMNRTFTPDVINLSFLGDGFENAEFIINFTLRTEERHYYHAGQTTLFRGEEVVVLAYEVLGSLHGNLTGTDLEGERRYFEEYIQVGHEYRSLDGTVLHGREYDLEATLWVEGLWRGLVTEGEATEWYVPAVPVIPDATSSNMSHAGWKYLERVVGLQETPVEARSLSEEIEYFTFNYTGSHTTGDIVHYTENGTPAAFDTVKGIWLTDTPRSTGATWFGSGRPSLPWSGVLRPLETGVPGLVPVDHILTTEAIDFDIGGVEAGVSHSPLEGGGSAITLPTPLEVEIDREAHLFLPVGDVLHTRFIPVWPAKADLSVIIDVPEPAIRLGGDTMEVTIHVQNHGQVTTTHPRNVTVFHTFEDRILLGVLEVPGSIQAGEEHLATVSLMVNDSTGIHRIEALMNSSLTDDGSSANDVTTVMFSSVEVRQDTMFPRMEVGSWWNLTGCSVGFVTDTDLGLPDPFASGTSYSDEGWDLQSTDDYCPGGLISGRWLLLTITDVVARGEEAAYEIGFSGATGPVGGSMATIVDGILWLRVRDLAFIGIEGNESDTDGSDRTPFSVFVTPPRNDLSFPIGIGSVHTIADSTVTSSGSPSSHALELLGVLPGDLLARSTAVTAGPASTPGFLIRVYDYPFDPAQDTYEWIRYDPELGMTTWDTRRDLVLLDGDHSVTLANDPDISMVYPYLPGNQRLTLVRGSATMVLPGAGDISSSTPTFTYDDLPDWMADESGTISVTSGFLHPDLDVTVFVENQAGLVSSGLLHIDWSPASIDLGMFRIGEDESMAIPPGLGELLDGNSTWNVPGYVSIDLSGEGSNYSIIPGDDPVSLLGTWTGNVTAPIGVNGADVVILELSGSVSRVNTAPWIDASYHPVMGIFEGDMVRFTASAVDDEGDSLEFEWYLDVEADVGVPISLDANWTWTAVPGTHTFTAVASETGSPGLSSQTELLVMVFERDVILPPRISILTTRWVDDDTYRVTGLVEMREEGHIYTGLAPGDSGLVDPYATFIDWTLAESLVDGAWELDLSISRGDEDEWYHLLGYSEDDTLVNGTVTHGVFLYIRDRPEDDARGFLPGPTFPSVIGVLFVAAGMLGGRTFRRGRKF